jgi:hypothetical protein
MNTLIPVLLILLNSLHCRVINLAPDLATLNETTLEEENCLSTIKEQIQSSCDNMTSEIHHRVNYS